VKAARENWLDGQDDLDPERLIFIDESGLSTKMARLRGWAPKGERCRAAIPHGHWRTTTFVSGFTLAGFVAPMLLDGPMDGESFLAWVEQMLAPTLRPDDIVVMDNLAATKSQVSGKLLKPAALNSAICRPTVPTSIRSKTPSQSLRRMCASPLREPSMYSNEPPPMRCNSSNPTNAPISSLTPDTAWIKRNLL
jgi:hypothetical protein